MSVEIKGADEIREKLRKLAVDHHSAAKAALHQEGLELMAEAVKRTPVDTGRLRASAYAKAEDGGGDQLREVVGFGADYALAVHERTEVRHETGQAKFLTSVLEERQGGFVDRMGERIKKNVESGVGMSSGGGEAKE